MTETRPSSGTMHEVALDAAVTDVRAGLPSWLDLPIEDRIRLLRDLQRHVATEAPGIVTEACASHEVPKGSLWEGDQWFSALAMSTHARAHEVALSRLAALRAPLPGGAVRTRAGGQVAVQVMPATRADRAFFAGDVAEVWLEPGVTADEVRAQTPDRHREFADPGVTLVLAAGNSSGLPVTDALYQLFVQGCTAIVKLNPVNDYLAPFLERIFVDFTTAGWVRFVTGDARAGAHLAHHTGIDRVHVTGSADTYNALTWGLGEQARGNRAAETPLLHKPFTAELGGVSPSIMVPGRWRRHDLRRWADRIAFQKLCNVGHFCNSTQILVLPKGWDQADTLLDDLRHFLRTLPPQQPFYPGTADRVARAVEGECGAEAMLAPDRRYLVTDLDPDTEASLFCDEVFADVLGVVELPAPSVDRYLAAATEFANDRLAGTLAAQIVIDPATAKGQPEALDRSIAGLRYGTVAVNQWVGFAYGSGYTTWGGYPGHTPSQIGSGVGVVGNAFDLPHPQRTVLTSPFQPPMKPITCASAGQRAASLHALMDFYAESDLRAVLRLLAAAARP